MRYVLGDEPAIGCLGEDVQEARHGTVLEVPSDGVAVAIDQRDGGEIHIALLCDDRHFLPCLVGRWKHIRLVIHPEKLISDASWMLTRKAGLKLPGGP
jgi:hypothetical protein